MPSDLFKDVLNSLTCTTLFCLEPIGVGTYYVESLASYLCRLAHSHSIYVGTLMTDIAPLLGNSLVASLKRGSSRLYERPGLFIGHNDFTLKLVNALEYLTGRKDLIYLTLLSWRHLIDIKGILKEVRSWCPICFAEWQRKKEPLYEPLIWALKFISVCPVHQCRLLSFCAVCKRTQPLLTRTTRPGYCAICKSPLWKETNADEVRAKIDDYDNWVLKNIMALLAQTPLLKHILLQKIVMDNLTAYIRSFPDASSFASASGIPHCTATRWVRGESFSSFYHLLQICYVTETPLMKLFNKGSLNHRDRLKPPPIRTQPIRTRNEFDGTRVRKHLEDHLSADVNSQITMNRVSQTLGISKKTLYLHFPELCRRIAEQAAKRRREVSQARLEQECLFVEKVCRQLHLADVYPSFESVEAACPRKAILRAKEVKTAWHRTMKQLGLWTNQTQEEV